MSLPDPQPPRKPRRLGLWLPFAALALAVAGWSGAWVWARGQALSRMDAGVRSLGQAGFPIAWKDRTVGGYPFRMDITLTEVTARAPSGWGLEAPRIEGEAFLHGLTHWLIAAPRGLTFVRPIGGPVAVKGQLIRASLSHLGQRPPSVSFEGVKLVFEPGAGAAPFALESAGRVEFHLRAGPDDEGGLFATLDAGKARPSALLGRIAGDKPVAMVWNSTLSKIGAFSGATWGQAVRHWSDAGGRMAVRQAGITAGDAVAGATTGVLGVAADGRLTGVLDLSLRQAPRVLRVLGNAGAIAPEAAEVGVMVAQARQGAGDTAQAALNFQAGRATLGPVALGPAPRVYEPR